MSESKDGKISSDESQRDVAECAVAAGNEHPQKASRWSSMAPHLRMIPMALGLVIMVWTVYSLADFLTHHDLGQLSLEELRDRDNPSRLIGPEWFQEYMRDVTALGGYAVLVMVVVLFAVFLRLENGRQQFRVFTMTVVGGYLCGVLMKWLAGRARPSIVPHLSYVSGHTSFPSSHALMSAVVYLSIGHFLSTKTSDRRLQRLLIVIPLCLTLMIGISRIFMGVHYPSDVFAGWTAGLLWTWGACRIGIPQCRNTVFNS